MNVSHTLGSHPNVSDTKPMSTRQNLMNEHSQITFSIGTMNVDTDMETAGIDPFF